MTATAPDRHGREEDARLPELPLFALLRTLEENPGIGRIDRIWVFPPRRMESGETSVVVVAAYPPDDGDRRHVLAARYIAPADQPEPRLVEQVGERLKEQPLAPAAAFRIEGRPDRWSEALHVLAERAMERAARAGRDRPPHGPPGAPEGSGKPARPGV